MLGDRPHQGSLASGTLVGRPGIAGDTDAQAPGLLVLLVLLVPLVPLVLLALLVLLSRSREWAAIIPRNSGNETEQVGRPTVSDASTKAIEISCTIMRLGLGQEGVWMRIHGSSRGLWMVI